MMVSKFRTFAAAMLPGSRVRNFAEQPDSDALDTSCAAEQWAPVNDANLEQDP